MREQLRQAAADGLIVGVKWAVAILVVAAAFALVAGDYGAVRRQSANGQRAFDALMQWQSRQQAPAAPKEQ